MESATCLDPQLVGSWHTTVPIVSGMWPKMDIMIQGWIRQFSEEEVPHLWASVQWLKVSGVGRNTKSQVTRDWLHWQDADGAHGEMRPLMVQRLATNLLGHGILGGVQAFLTMDQQDFFLFYFFLFILVSECTVLLSVDSSLR